jgi:hypothetical protein
MSDRTSHAGAMALDWNAWLGGLPPEHRAALESQVNDAPDREAERRILTNTAFLHERTGIPIATIAEKYETVRSGYAAAEGWGDVGDTDEAFHARVTDTAARDRDEDVLWRGTPDDNEAGTQTRAASMLYAAANAGSDPDQVHMGKTLNRAQALAESWQKWQTRASKSPAYRKENTERYYRAFTETFNKANLDYEAGHGPAKEALKLMRSGDEITPHSVLPLVSELSDAQFAIFKREVAREADKATASRPDQPDGLIDGFVHSAARGMANMLASSAEFAGKAFVSRRFKAGDMIRKGAFKDGFEAAVEFAATDNPEDTLSADMMQPLTEEQATAFNGYMDKQARTWRRLAQLRDLSLNTADPIDKDTLAKMLVYGAGDSAGILAAYAVPVVGAATAFASYTSNEENRLVEDGMAPAKARYLAPWIGAAQMLLDKVQVSLLKKMPGLDGLLSKYATSSVSRFAGRYAATAVGETAIEITQDTLTPAIVQQAGHWLDSEIPGLNGGQVWEKAVTSAPEIFASMLLLPLLGTGRATVRDMKGADTIARDAHAMQLLGFSPDHISAVLTAEDGQAVPTLQRLWNERTPALAGDSAGLAKGDAAALAGEAQAEHERATRLAPGVTVTQRSAATLAQPTGDTVTLSGGGTGVQGEPETGDGMAPHATPDPENTEAEDNAAAGIRDLRRGADGWYLTTTDGQRIEAGSIDAAHHLRETLLLANSEKVAGAFTEVADWIVAGFAAQGEPAEVRLSGDTVSATRQGISTQTPASDAVTFLGLPTAQQAVLTSQLDRLAAGDEGRQLNGSNWIAEDGTRIIASNQSEEGVFTLLHETVESRFKTIFSQDKGRSAVVATRALVNAGLFNPATARTPAAKQFAERVQAIAAGKRKPGIEGDTEIRETIVELMVADAAARSKDGTRVPSGAIRTAVDSLLKTSLPAADRAALGWFRTMLRAIRAHVHGIFATAAHLTKARREGKIKEGDDFHQYADRLLGIDSQKKHEAAVLGEAGERFEGAVVERIQPVPRLAPQGSPYTAGIRAQLPSSNAADGLYGSAAKNNMDSGERQDASFSIGSFREDALEPSYSGSIFTDASETQNPPDAQAGQESGGSDVSAAGGEIRSADQEQDAPPGAGRGLKAVRAKARARLDMAQHNRRVAGDWVAARRGEMLAPLDGQQLDGAVALWAEETVDAIENALRDGLATKAQMTDIRPPLYYAKSRQITSDADKIAAEAVSERMENILAPLVEDLGFTRREEPNAHLGMSHRREESGVSFSLGSVNALESVANRLEGMKGGAKAKLDIYQDMGRTISGMARAARGNEDVDAVVKLGKIEAQRVVKRKALYERYRDDAENEIYSRHGDLLAQPELGETFNSDLMDYLFRAKQPGKQFRESRIMSRAQAVRNAKAGGFTLGGEYDGARDLPRWVFSPNGSTPDQILEDLRSSENADGTPAFPVPEDAGPDWLWSEIEMTLANSTAYAKQIREVEGLLIEAREDARTRATNEAREWANAEKARMAESDKRDASRALVALDAMLLHLPAAVRGKVGGFTKLAQLNTNKQREAYFHDRLTKIDNALEDYLREKTLAAIVAAIKAGKARMVAGEKDKGKLGVNGHTYLNKAEEAMTLGMIRLAEREAFIEARLSGATPLSDEEIADITREWDYGTDEDAARTALEQESAILDLFGGLTHKGRQINVPAATNAAGVLVPAHVAGGRYTRDSGEMEAALEALQETILAGRQGWHRQLIARRERRAGRRAGVKLDSKNNGGLADIAERKAAMQKAGAAVTRYFRKGFDFQSYVGDIFGRESDTHRWAEDTVRDAELVTAGLWQDSQNRMADFWRGLWPRTGTAGRLRKMEELSTPRAVPGVPVGTPKMSQMEAVHWSMMWADEASQEWLRKYDLGQDTQDAIEKWLSPEAKAFRSFLEASYDAQYDQLNTVFRRLHGTNMPRVKNYAPRAVEHGKAAVAADPLQMGGLSSRGVFAGFTKRRRPDLSAAPVATDALAAFVNNQRVVTHFLGWAEASADLRAVFSTSETAPFIKAAAGEQGALDLNQWLTDLEAGGVREAQASTLAQRWLKANVDDKLTGKLAVLLKQAPAYLSAATEIGWTDYLASARRVMNGTAARSVAGSAASRVIQSRSFQRPAEIDQAVRGAGARPYVTRLRRYGVDLNRIDLAMDWLRGRIGATDAWLTARSAAIAYDAHFHDAKAMKMADAEAHAYAEKAADRTVMRTAQPETNASKSLAENHAGRWGKFFFQFQTMNRQMLFSTIASFRDEGIKSGAGWRKAFTFWAVNGIITQTLGNIIRDLISDDDEDEQWKLADYGRSLIMGPLTGAVHVGPLLDAFMSLFGGFERKQAMGPTAALTSAGKEIAEAMKDGEPFDFKDQEKIARGIGSLLGGRWAALNVAENIGKQLIGTIDNVWTTEQEALEAKAKANRAKKKEAKDAEAEAVTPEDAAAAGQKKAERKQAALERDAAG